MTSLSDAQLLEEYARSKSEAAFSTLVQRHLNLVYSAAFRHTSNAHHAEEITQAVFIILSQKAASLKRGTVLSGWLYQTARLTSANFIKAEKRRVRREQEAYMQSTVADTDSKVWERIAPLLDEALGTLGELDRNAIVLSYFERKTANDIALALQMNESAAYKRINRAVDKLRKFFANRGIALSAAALAGVVSTSSVHAAPAGLASSITLIATKGAAMTASTGTLVQTTLNLMAWAKAKLAVSLGLGLLATAAVMPYAWHYTKTHVGPDAWMNRFEDVYGLEQGQLLKHIQPPYIPERVQFLTNNNRRMGPGKPVPIWRGSGIPQACFFGEEQVGIKLLDAVGAIGPVPLEQILVNLFRRSRPYFQIAPELADLRLEGDWTQRFSGTATFDLIPALKQIVFKETGKRITIEVQPLDREVLVAQVGSSRQFKSALDKKLTNRLDIYAESKAGEGLPALDGQPATGEGVPVEFMKWIEDLLGVEIAIGKVAEDISNVSLSWQAYADAKINPDDPNRGTKINEVLTHLTQQTGITFTREKRKVLIWVVTEQK